MWILHFLPDSVILWFCNILLLVGIALSIAGLFAHRIPLIWQYQLPFKVLGIALLALGIYFRGGYAVEAEWRERVAQVEEQLKVAEQRSAELNDALAAAANKKTQIVRNRTEYITRYIDREIVRYDEKFNKDGICAIPPEFVKAHNDAAKKPETK